MNNTQLPQKEDVNYLGFYLDRRLIWHKHIFAKRKQLGFTLTKMYWLLQVQVKTPHKQQTSHITHYSYQSGITEYGSWVWLPLLTEIPAHDSGSTLVRAKYG
jgi:hypothetical protein